MDITGMSGLWPKKEGGDHEVQHENEQAGQRELIDVWQRLGNETHSRQWAFYFRYKEMFRSQIL